jgi:hypothetical protein
MLEYFGEMCKFADVLEQTIIIGGDFNLPVLDWKDEVEAKFQGLVSVALYVPIPRRWNRDRFIDTFAIVQPSNSGCQTKATFEETMGIYQYPLVDRVGGDDRTDLRDYPSDSPQNRWFKYVHFNNTDLKKVKDALIKKDKADLPKYIQKKADEKTIEKDTKEILSKKDTEEMPKEESSKEYEKEKKKAEMPVDAKEKISKEHTEEELIQKELAEKYAKQKKEESSKENEKEEKEKSSKETNSKNKKSKPINTEKLLEEIIKHIRDGTHLSEPFTKMKPSGAPAPLWPNSCLHQVLDHDPVLTKIRITLKRNNSVQHDTSTTPQKRVTRSTKIN